MVELAVIGINSKCCPIYLREIITQAFENDFGQRSHITHSFSYVLLSTCHRVEIYFSGQDIGSIHVEILAILRKYIVPPFEHFLYSYFESDVFFHLAKVTCGFDSAIIGESEIQRQVKIAYESAKNEQLLSFYLHYLFQKSLKIGKTIRSQYGAWKKEFNLEDVIISKIQDSFKETFPKKVLFIGYSDMNRKLFSLFYKKGFRSITLASRVSDLIEIKKKHPFLQVVGRDHLSNWQDYDIVVSATKQLDCLLKQSQEEREHIQLIFDLSIPRSIDPETSKKKGVSLFNIEDIATLFEDKKQRYEKELIECEYQIQKCVERSFFLYQKKLLKRKELILSTHFVHF